MATALTDEVKWLRFAPYVRHRFVCHMIRFAAKDRDHIVSDSRDRNFETTRTAPAATNVAIFRLAAQLRHLLKIYI